MDDNPVLVPNPSGSAKSAVVFAHGFVGDQLGTWSGFPDLLTGDRELSDYDFYFWGYPSQIKLRYAVTKYFWESDPGIDTIGQGLRTVLNTMTGDYGRLVLVGHSMGGLVIQAFILEEIAAGRTDHLGRLGEVVLYATPSAGKREARWGRWLKEQIADMSDVGPFITKLRTGWRQWVDDVRSDSDRPSSFRLTLVAGMKDRFVTQESALGPFPFDDHEFGPGNHTEVVKPLVVGETPFHILKRRLLRDNPTPEQLHAVYGADPQAVVLMAQIRAATELADTDSLVGLADMLLAAEPEYPSVERSLGIELSREMDYERAEQLMKRCLSFSIGGERPYAGDLQVVQQLAVVMSARGDNTGAVALLESLPVEMRDQSETLGIKAGRLKRHWHLAPEKRIVGQNALTTYEMGYVAATEAGDTEQILYNGINLAYMQFRMGAPFEQVAQAVADLAVGREDYWAMASLAEAHLLLGDFTEAHDSYAAAIAPHSRYLWTTMHQALRIVTAMGNPPEAKPIVDLIGSNFPQLLEGRDGEDMMPDDD